MSGNAKIFSFSQTFITGLVLPVMLVSLLSELDSRDERGGGGRGTEDTESAIYLRVPLEKI